MDATETQLLGMLSGVGVIRALAFSSDATQLAIGFQVEFTITQLSIRSRKAQKIQKKYIKRTVFTMRPPCFMLVHIRVVRLAPACNCGIKPHPKIDMRWTFWTHTPIAVLTAARFYFGNRKAII